MHEKMSETRHRLDFSRNYTVLRVGTESKAVPTVIELTITK